MCEYLKMKDCFVIARRIERDDSGMYLLTRLSEENIKNEEYLNSVEGKTVPKGEINGTTRRVPLEKEADR